MHGDKPCWQCHHFGGWRVEHYTKTREPYADSTCAREAMKVQTQPQFGCVFFEREAGADDESYSIDPTGRRRNAGLK